MRIDSAEEEQSGEYKVVAKNHAGVDEAVWLVSVDQPASVVNPLTPTEVKIGEEFNLECVIAGTPVPEAKW